MAKRAHSKHGASGAKRFMSCPGSLNAQEGLVETESAAAIEGTRAHALAQHCLENGEADAKPYVGEVLTCDETGDFVVTLDMANAVNVYLKAVFDVLKPEDELYIEQSFEIRGVDGAQLFGTNDCAILKPDGTLYIFDYKHGAGVTVEVEGNPQVRYYALGAIENVPGGEKVHTVVVTIVQPRKPHTDGPVRSETIDRFDLLEFKGDLLAAVAKTLDPNAPRVPGSHCTFCKAAGTPRCPEFKKAADDAALNAFGEIPDETEIAAFDADEIGRRLKAIPFLRAYCKALERFARDDGLANDHLPTGFKWIIGREGNRAWTGDVLAVAAKLKTAWPSLDVLEPPSLQSPAQIEKATGKKPLADFAKLHGLISRSPGAPKLVPMEHKSEAVTLEQAKAAAKTAVFEELED